MLVNEFWCVNFDWDVILRNAILGCRLSYVNDVLGTIVALEKLSGVDVDGNAIVSYLLESFQAYFC